jgi:hypothetical protein
MDGRGSWRDNVFVERFWKSVKYEEVYLHAYESVGQAKAGIGRYLDFYNNRRPHTALDKKTPDEFYFASLLAIQKAARPVSPSCPPRRSCVRRMRRPPPWTTPTQTSTPQSSTYQTRETV